MYDAFNFITHVITGYNQSVTGCGSQRRHVVVTQLRDPNPQIEFDFVEKHIH